MDKRIAANAGVSVLQECLNCPLGKKGQCHSIGDLMCDRVQKGSKQTVFNLDSINTLTSYSVGKC